MAVALIDYGAGNLHSAEKAFRHVAGNQEICVTADPRLIAQADRIVLPGVGAFADCIQGLQAISGLTDALTEAVITRQRPFLGICVGMQMMMESGVEHGIHSGLGWIKGQVEAIHPVNPHYKIPHMGWNDLHIHDDHPVLHNIHAGDHAYFVHSFHALCTNPQDVLATVDYGTPITAIIARDNMIGAQFHPEKSQKTGLKLIKNFLTL
ncbi:MAG: imidazole glycerol phosphate synthase subunit HisH [Alphaproteobacteria bacterium]|nr:imidazole glycerol phosphate synthase subunit HisH [Alphaproteobacteria bacterium]